MGNDDHTTHSVRPDTARGTHPMTVIDLLITIIVVTILVTIALGVMTYLAYKLRLARRPSQVQGEEEEAHYFVVHEPASEAPAPSEEDASET